MILQLLALVGALAGEPCEEAVPVRAGQVIACDAIAMPSPWAQSMLKCQEVELPRLRAEIDFEKRMQEIKVRELRDQLEIERETLKRYRQILENPPRAPFKWYEHPAFWGAVGMSAGVAVGVSLAVN